MNLPGIPTGSLVWAIVVLLGLSVLGMEWDPLLQCAGKTSHVACVARRPCGEKGLLREAAVATCLGFSLQCVHLSKRTHTHGGCRVGSLLLLSLQPYWLVPIAQFPLGFGFGGCAYLAGFPSLLGVQPWQLSLTWLGQGVVPESPPSTLTADCEVLSSPTRQPRALTLCVQGWDA